MCGFFKRNCLWLQQFLLPTQSPKLWGLTFLALELWAEGPGMGLGLLAPEISLLNFFIHAMWVWDQPFPHLRLPSVWMDVVSLIPQLSDFHSTSDSSE